MNNRQVLINATMSVAQVAALGVTLFLLYRFLIRAIGAEQLGIWSVVLATTSVTNIAGLGFSGSVVKFVAKYVARGNERAAAEVTQTAALSIGLAIGIVVIAAYPLIRWALTIIISESSLNLADSVLPYGLASFWIMAVARVFQAGLDGVQRIDQRSMLLIGAAIFYLFLCYALVPTYGLMGLAYAQLVQAITLLITSYFLLKRCIRILPIFPHRWSRSIFVEMLGYSFNFQVASVFQMAYDPITKALVTKFGGLTMMAYYEMASRMIMQVRALLVSANQVLVPAIAELQEKNARILEQTYKVPYRVMFYLAVLLFSTVVAFTPVISQIWIGHYENTFVLFTFLVASGWFINTLTAPAYFSNLGTGDVGWNTVGHVAIGVLNAGVGLLLGSLYGGAAVVVAWVLSLVIGSLIIICSYHFKHRVPLDTLLPTESRMFALASAVGLLTAFWTYYWLSDLWNLPTVLAAVFIIFSAVVVYPALVHPLRRRCFEWLTNYVLKTRT